MGDWKEVKIFIASSIVEFRDERTELRAFLDRLNKLYKPRRVRLEWNSPEEMSHEMPPDGSQSEIDREIRDCQFFFLIVGQKLGAYTAGEFELAWNLRNERGYPKIYPYFYNPGGAFPSDEVTEFRRSLKERKYYPNTYAGIREIEQEMHIELIRAGAFDTDAEPSSREEAAKRGREAARELIAEQREKVAELKARKEKNVTPELIAELTDAYENLTKLVQEYKLEPDALLDYMDFLWKQHLYDRGIALGHWLEGFYSMEDPGDDTWSVLKNRLGLCYRGSNQHKQGEQYYREELEIERRLSEGNPVAYEPDVAATCNNLANLLTNANRKEEAEGYYREALEIYRRLAEGNPGAYEPYVAGTCNNLANLLNNTNRKEEAKGYYREALEIRRRLAEGNPAAYEPYVAGTCNNLALLLDHTNRQEEAERYYRETLQIYRRLAEGNPAAYEPDVAMTCNNIGELFRVTNRMEEAERYYREALKIRRRLAESNPGAYEPDVAETCYNLGLFEDERGNRNAARRYFEEALRIEEKYPHLAKNAEDDRNQLARL